MHFQSIYPKLLLTTKGKIVTLQWRKAGKPIPLNMKIMVNISVMPLLT